MNTAARMVEQGSLFQGGIHKVTISKDLITVIFLSIFVLMSAFAVVYFKNYERSLFSQHQYLQQTADRLQVEYGQLLLEQSTWANPARVQRIAKRQLGMELPTPREVVMVDEE